MWCLWSIRVFVCVLLLFFGGVGVGGKISMFIYILLLTSKVVSVYVVISRSLYVHDSI